MGMMTAAIVALGAGVAGAQIMGGYAANKEAESNARLYEERAGRQAGMIDARAEVEGAQYDRARGRTRGASTAAIAGKGLLLSGSPLSVMIDTETQMRLDQSIGQYNFAVQRRNVLSQGRSAASAYRQEGRRAKSQGFTNAFTTLLSTAATVGMMNMPVPKHFATVKGMGKVRVAPPNYYLRAGSL